MLTITPFDILFMFVYLDQHIKLHKISRTPWSCGLIRHVLDRKVEFSNLAGAQNLFQFKSTKISSRKLEQKKKGKLSLIASVRAVAVREEEEMSREKRKKWRHHLKHQSYVVAPSDSICVILTKLLLENIDHRW